MTLDEYDKIEGALQALLDKRGHGHNHYVELDSEKSIVDGSFTAVELRAIAYSMDDLKHLKEKDQNR